MTIMASSVLLQNRLNMKPVDEVDRALKEYEALVKREGKEQASMIGLADVVTPLEPIPAPKMEELIEKIDSVAKKERVEHQFDYLLDFSTSTVYRKSEEKGAMMGKSSRKPSRTASPASENNSTSGSSITSEAETYLSQFYSTKTADVTHPELLNPEPVYEETSALKAKVSHQNRLQKVLMKVLKRDDVAMVTDGATTSVDGPSTVDDNLVRDFDDKPNKISPSPHLPNTPPSPTELSEIMARYKRPSSTHNPTPEWEGLGSEEDENKVTKFVPGCTASSVNGELESIPTIHTESNA